jgi:hypothetical protein
MVFGSMARRAAELRRENPPERKFNDGDLVEGKKNVAIIGKKLVLVRGVVQGAEYRTADGLFDFDWQYRVVNPQGGHSVPERRLKPATVTPTSEKTG